MGALIGDALGVGPHWYYDLDELHRDYGTWITGYNDPKSHSHHAGLKAGHATSLIPLRQELNSCEALRRRTISWSEISKGKDCPLFSKVERNCSGGLRPPIPNVRRPETAATARCHFLPLCALRASS